MPGQEIDSILAQILGDQGSAPVGPTQDGDDPAWAAMQQIQGILANAGVSDPKVIQEIVDSFYANPDMPVPPLPSKDAQGDGFYDERIMGNRLGNSFIQRGTVTDEEGKVSPQRFNADPTGKSATPEDLLRLLMGK